MQWNKPTLYEVFNSLLAIFGCCLEMNTFDVLTYKELAPNGSEVNESYLNGYESKMNMSNYASSLDAEVTNGITNEYTIETPIISPRSKNGVLTTENCALILEKPIYLIKKALIKNPVSISYNAKEGTSEYPAGIVAQDVYDLDIVEFIVEKTLYDLMLSIPDYLFEETGKQYKRNHLYYTTGDNEIGGLSYAESTLFGNPSQTKSIDYIAQEVAYKWLVENYGVTDPSRTNAEIPPIRDILFQIEYTTQDTIRVKVHKADTPRNEYTQIDNQKDAFVDIDNFGKNEESVVNSMANKEVERTGICYNPNQLEELGNYILVGSKKYILYKREYQMYDDYILFKYYFSENYANQNLTSLLSQVKRYTQVADAKDSLLRIENISKKYKFTTGYANYQTDGFTAYLMGQLAKADYRNKHISRSYLSDGTYTNYYILVSQNLKIGNSILCSMKFLDNYAVGYQIANTNSAGGYGEKQVAYCDNYGEATRIDINFGAYGDAQYQYEEDIPLINIARKYPETYNNQPELTDTIEKAELLVYKDNREQLQIGFQFSFLNSANGFFYDDFITLSPLLNKAVKQLKVYESNENYDGTETSVKGSLSTASLNIINNRIMISGLNLTSKGVAIVLEEGNNVKLVCSFNKSFGTNLDRYLIEE